MKQVDGGDGKKKSNKKHFWYGVIFLVAGLCRLGYYAINGDFKLLGSFFALFLTGFGIHQLISQKQFLKQTSFKRKFFRSIAMIVFVFFFLGMFFEPYKVNGHSMAPTLLHRDYFLVGEYSYCCLVPFTQTRIFLGEGPKLGDIVSFQSPQDPHADSISRIVGLPGDHVVYSNKRLHLNGKAVDYQGDGRYQYYNSYGQSLESLHLKESLMGAVHSILLRPLGDSKTTDIMVPAGHYFVMSDNRDISIDSRYWGVLPAYRLIGKILVVFWSWDEHEERVRWQRLGWM